MFHLSPTSTSLSPACSALPTRQRVALVLWASLQAYSPPQQQQTHTDNQHMPLWVQKYMQPKWRTQHTECAIYVLLDFALKQMISIRKRRNIYHVSLCSFVSLCQHQKFECRCIHRYSSPPVTTAEPTTMISPNTNNAKFTVTAWLWVYIKLCAVEALSYLIHFIFWD